MYVIQLDIASDCPFSTIINDTLEFNIAAKLITHVGPAGGNPLFEFYGSKKDLKRFVETYDFYCPESDYVKV